MLHLAVDVGGTFTDICVFDDESGSTRVGQRVWVWGAQSARPFGTAAEYTAVPEAQADALPNGVGFGAGACLGIPARTAHRCVFADETCRVCGRRQAWLPSSPPATRLSS